MSVKTKKIRAQLNERIQEVAEFLLPAGHLSGDQRHWIVGDSSGTEGSSLKLELTGEKKGLFYDFAEESGGDIFDLWQSARNVDFPTALAEAEKFLAGQLEQQPQSKLNGAEMESLQTQKQKPNRMINKEIFHWDYFDNDGNFVGYVIRYENDEGDKNVIPHFRPTDDPKKFDRGYPDSMNESGRPLYGDPPDSNDLLYVAEGEKTAQALRMMGLPACTSPGGSSAAQLADWSRLKGVKHVVIWRDNDDAGLKFANSVAEIIHDMEPNCQIKVICADTFGDGADAVDVLQTIKPEWDGYRHDTELQQNGMDMLKALALDHAQPWQPPEPKPALYLSLKQILQQKLRWTWIVQGLLLEGRVYQLHGQWKAGKSLVTLDMALHLATGKAWCGKGVVKCLVVYVAGEAAVDIQARIQAFQQRHGLDPKATFVLRCLPVHLTDKDAAAKLREEIEQIQKQLEQPLPVVTIIDTVARNFGPGKSESSDVDMGAFINHVIDEVSRPLNATILAVHHPGHSNKNRGRGHSSLPGAVDGTLQVAQKDGVITLDTKEMRSVRLSEDLLAWQIEGVDIASVDNFGEPVNAPVLVPYVLPDHNRLAAELARTEDECTYDVMSRLLWEHAQLRQSEPQNPEGYPSQNILTALSRAQGRGTKSIERVLQRMKESGELADFPLPKEVSARGRNHFVGCAHDRPYTAPGGTAEVECDAA